MILDILLWGAGSIIVLEAVSFLAHWLVYGQAFSWVRLKRERNAAASEAGSSPLAQEAPQPNFILHPYFGFVRSPGSEPDVNSFGFRGEHEPVQKRRAGRLVIGVLGGSVARCFYAKGKDAFRRTLSTHPDLANKELIMVAAALGGYKQPQQLLILTYLLGLGAEFDIVVAIDGFNEVALHEAENKKKNVSASFPRDWYMLINPVPTIEMAFLIGRLLDAQGRRRRLASIFCRPVLRHSITTGLIWRLLDSRVKSEADAAFERIHDEEARPPKYATTGPPKQYADDRELYEDLASIWKRCSLQMDRVCRANGIKFFHFLQPNQYVPGSKEMSQEEREVAYDPNHAYRPGVEKGYSLLRKAGEDLAAQGVRFRDLTMLFAGVREPIYIDSCCHFNQKGNDMMAAAVGEAIIQDVSSSGSDTESAGAAI